MKGYVENEFSVYFDLCVKNKTKEYFTIYYNAGSKIWDWDLCIEYNEKRKKIEKYIFVYESAMYRWYNLKLLNCREKKRKNRWFFVCILKFIYL